MLTANENYKLQEIKKKKKFNLTVEVVIAIILERLISLCRILATGWSTLWESLKNLIILILKIYNK